VDQALFQNGEIKGITTKMRHYSSFDFTFGVGPTVLAAIDRTAPTRVFLIPITAVEAIEVEYGEQQAAGQDTPPA